MNLTKYFKSHWVGYLIASIGIALNAICLFECARQGPSLYEHIAGDIIHHALIFSTLPLFSIVGFLVDRKMTLEREIKEYSNLLHQRIDELKESDKKNRALLENAGIPIFTLDGAGRILWGNKKTNELTGYHISELIGKPAASLLSQSDGKMLMEKLSNLSGTSQFEVELQAKSGKRIVELTMQPIELEGKIAGIQCLAIDVTEKREMEEEIIESHRYLSSVISNSADAIIGLDAKGNIVLFNEGAERTFGSREEEVLLRNIVENGEVKFFEDLEAARRMMKLMRESPDGKVSNLEVKGKTRQGRELYLSLSASLLRDQNGEILGSIGIAKDITDKKLAEEALRESERRYRDLFENAYDAIYTCDLNGFITSINAAGARITGYTREEMLGMNLSKLLPPKELQTARDGLQRVAMGERMSISSLEYEFIRKDGTRGILEVSIRPILEGSKVIGVHCIARDITEKKILQQKIVESERYLKNIIESSGDAVIALDANGNIVLFNEGAEKIFGYHREELIGKNIVEDGKARFYGEVEIARRVMRAMSESEGGRITNFEVPGKTKDGKDIYLSVSASLLKNEKDEIIGSLGITKDITERKRAEEELKVKAQLLDAATDSILMHDSDGNLVYVNEATYKNRGYSKEELMGTNLYNMVVPEYAKSIEPRLKELWEKGEATFETAHFRKDMSIMPIEVHAKIIESGGKKLILSVNRDITQRKQAEAEIQRSYDAQTAINSLLRISLEDIPLDEILKRALDLILSVPWLAFELRGSIFLVEDEPEMLVMKAQNGLEQPIQNLCARIPFGRCLCGRAALSKEIEFAATLDDRHEVKYEGIYSHGHYCVPILSAGRLLGVINLYLREGHRRDQREEEFLYSIADALAGIIERKQMEQQVLQVKDTAELYLDIMSHDINNLNQIGLGYLELLIDSGKLEEVQRRYAGKVLNSVRGSISLIENVRLLQQIKETKDFIDVDLNEVISKVIDDFSVNPYKKVVFNYAPRSGLTVRADPLINEIFVNLVGNSIKYSGGSVEIGICVDKIVEGDGDKDKNVKLYRVCVEDNGDGVPDEKKQVIFRRFERGSRKASGKGLGLHIVKMLVEKYGGDIWVEDRVKGDYSKGARFCFTIPKAEVGENGSQH